MQRVEMWKASDGKFFETETECAEYEKKLSSVNEIAFSLEREFCFTTGYSTPERIAEYIIDNLEKFNLKFKED